MRRLLFSVMAIMFIATACAPTGSSSRALPEDDLEFLEGGLYDLDAPGQPRALNLWATWCAPCRAELPAFDNVASRAQGVDVIGVNTGESGPEATELVEELGLGFTQVLDPNARIRSALGITGMPATIFVNGDGQVVDIHSGELTIEELEDLLADLFGATFDSQ